MVVAPLQVQANCEAELKGCIHDCTAALDAADKVIAQYKDLYRTTLNAFNDCEASNSKLSVDLEKAQAGRDAWYRQPVTMIAIGVVVGVLALSYLKK